MRRLIYFSLITIFLLISSNINGQCPSTAGSSGNGSKLDLDFAGGINLGLISSITIGGVNYPSFSVNNGQNDITVNASSGTFGGNGAYQGSIIIFYSAGGSLDCSFDAMGNLPVELTSFQASKSSQGVELAWSTASEVNNEMFQVERSGDGQSFSAIGAIAGAGTTQEAQAYAFMDKSPLPGLNYYRLKQMDFDGQFEYSDIVSAWVESSSLRIYPNPTQGQIKVALPEAEVKGTYQVFNPAGQVLLQGAIQGDVIDLSSINNGLYYLQINTNGRIETQKILKQ